MQSGRPWRRTHFPVQTEVVELFGDQALRAGFDSRVPTRRETPQDVDRFIGFRAFARHADDAFRRAVRPSVTRLRVADITLLYSRAPVSQCPGQIEMPSSKRILLTTFGSFGNVHPYMAIALELQAPRTPGRDREPAKLTAPRSNRPAWNSRPSPGHPPGPETERLMKRVMDSKTGTKVVVRESCSAISARAYVDTLEARCGDAA